MGLVSFLSCLYLVFTIVLMFKKNSIGKLYMIFGLLTFIFVIGYSLIPIIPKGIQDFGIFVIFSLMILLFGIMFGTTIKMFKKSNKASQITSVVASLILILILFNVVGWMSYMYIPVLLYMLQDKINNYTDKLVEVK